MRKIDKRKNKIVPDRIFCKLWLGANRTDDLDDYIHEFLSIQSSDYVNLQKYGIDVIQSRDMLTNIYNAAKMSVNDIIAASGVKRTDVQYRFGFPKRTLQAWLYGDNPAAPYIRLVLLREYNLLKLGTKIVLESECPVKNSTKWQGRRKQPQIKGSTFSVASVPVESDDSMDKQLQALDMKFEKFNNKYKTEDILTNYKNSFGDKNSTSALLASTDYLAESIKRWKNK